MIRAHRQHGRIINKRKLHSFSIHRQSLLSPLSPFHIVPYFYVSCVDIGIVLTIFFQALTTHSRVDWERRSRFMMICHFCLLLLCGSTVRLWHEVWDIADNITQRKIVMNRWWERDKAHRVFDGVYYVTWNVIFIIWVENTITCSSLSNK